MSIHRFCIGMISAVGIDALRYAATRSRLNRVPELLSVQILEIKFEDKENQMIFSSLDKEGKIRVAFNPRELRISH